MRICIYSCRLFLSDWNSDFEIAEVQIVFLVYVLRFVDIGVFNKKSLDHHLDIF